MEDIDHRDIFFGIHGIDSLVVLNIVVRMNDLGYGLCIRIEKLFCDSNMVWGEPLRYMVGMHLDGIVVDIGAGSLGRGIFHKHRHTSVAESLVQAVGFQFYHKSKRT